MQKRLIYVSTLMTAGEVHKACLEFREQEARIRRRDFTVITNKKVSDPLPSRPGYFFDRETNVAQGNDTTHSVPCTT